MINLEQKARIFTNKQRKWIGYFNETQVNEYDMYE